MVDALGLPTHCIKSIVLTILLLYLVQTTLYGMDNAIPLRVKWTVLLPGIYNAIFSPSGMDNATPSPCRIDMQCHSLSM